MTVQAGQRWHHKGRGTTYEVIAMATGQGSCIEGLPVVVYRGDDEQVWARALGEFANGRFDLVPDPPALASKCPHCDGADYGCPLHACPVCAKSSAQRPHAPGCPETADLAGLARREQPPPPNLADYTDIGSGHPPRGRIGIP